MEDLPIFQATLALEKAVYNELESTHLLSLSNRLLNPYLLKVFTCLCSVKFSQVKPSQELLCPTCMSVCATYIPLPALPTCFHSNPCIWKKESKRSTSLFHARGLLTPSHHTDYVCKLYYSLLSSAISHSNVFYD